MQQHEITYDLKWSSLVTLVGKWCGSHASMCARRSGRWFWISARCLGVMTILVRELEFSKCRCLLLGNVHEASRLLGCKDVRVNCLDEVWNKRRPKASSYRTTRGCLAWQTKGVWQVILWVVKTIESIEWASLYSILPACQNRCSKLST